MNGNLIDLLQNAVSQSSFAIREKAGCTAHQIKDVYENSSGADKYAAVFAQPQISECLLSDMQSLLSIMLKPFTAEGYVGYGPANLLTGTLPSIDDICNILVRSSAILGPVETEKTLLGWIKGKPLCYSEAIVLNGISIAQPFMLSNGISFTALSDSNSELPVYLSLREPSSGMTHTVSGRVKLSIPFHTEKPALYKPEPPYTEITSTGANLALSPPFLRSICEGISLACNHYVDWTATWPEYGDLVVFNNGMGAINAWHDVDTRLMTEMTPDHFRNALVLCEKRKSSKDNGGLDLAISRWCKSKNSTQDLRDRFIDLRIALESLYLKDLNEELGFRLAIRGAWHIGSDVEQRRSFYDTLKDAYNQASKAVHGGKVSHGQNNVALLKAAQDICREGILKRLNEEEKPDWNAMILGDAPSERPDEDGQQ